MDTNNFSPWSLGQIRAALDQKEIMVRELNEFFYNRLNSTQPILNTFITINSWKQLEKFTGEAQKKVDEAISSPLTGIPYAVKDAFCTKGIRTTAASKILAEYTPPYSATVVKRSSEGVLFGKTNMDEFAMGVSNEYSAFGPVKNPYDLERVPGGTSGGSAAAVASGQIPFSLGTDTGGSVRQPASFCNVVGLRPTYGRISRYGVIAMASSFDTVGIIARSVEDVAYVLHELAGHDEYDSTTPQVPVDDYVRELDGEVKKLKIGIVKEWNGLKGMDRGVEERYKESINILERLGMEITEVSLSHSPYSLAVYYILVPSEVSSNLARYDGVTFGQPSKQAKSLEEVFLKTRQQGFGPEAKRRIMIGTFCLSQGYYDAYYRTAQKVRSLIIEDFSEVFKKVDLLFAPTAPTPAFKIGEHNKDPLAMYLADILTAPASVAGVPAISVPAGFVGHLPVGMQFIGPQFQESRLLRTAHAFQQSTDFKQQPLKV